MRKWVFFPVKQILASINWIILIIAILIVNNDTVFNDTPPLNAVPDIDDVPGLVGGFWLDPLTDSNDTASDTTDSEKEGSTLTFDSWSVEQGSTQNWTSDSGNESGWRYDANPSEVVPVLEVDANPVFPVSTQPGDADLSEHGSIENWVSDSGDESCSEDGDDPALCERISDWVAEVAEPGPARQGDTDPSFREYIVDWAAEVADPESSLKAIPETLPVYGERGDLTSINLAELQGWEIAGRSSLIGTPFVSLK